MVKRAISITVVLFISTILCASLFAVKNNLTVSAFSDVRLKTWISKSGSVSVFNNNGNVKTGVGPAIGYFYIFNDRFESGAETKLVIREAQTNKYYLQQFVTAIFRWKYFGNKECSLFLDFGTGPVFSYLGTDLSSYGWDFELGCGMRFNLKNNKAISIKTNVVGNLEKYKNAVTTNATVFVLSAQPVAVGFSWKY